MRAWTFETLDACSAILGRETGLAEKVTVISRSDARTRARRAKCRKTIKANTALATTPSHQAISPGPRECGMRIATANAAPKAPSGGAPYAPPLTNFASAERIPHS
jgi:hypothetical protein